MEAPNLNSNQRYTYQDYLTWDDEERWELIDGMPYLVAAPNTKHQRISRELLTEFSLYLRGKTCEVFDAPFEVRLLFGMENDLQTDKVVQPDLAVVCDPNKVDEKGCKGTPDLIIEILSPSSGKLDKMIKRNLYEKTKVREYWIVDPEHELVEVYFLDENGRYSPPQVFSSEEEIQVGIFDDFIISLKTVFGKR